jgi:hypothetical protein
MSQVPMNIAFSNRSLRGQTTKVINGRLYNFICLGQSIRIRTRELMLSKLQKDQSSLYRTSNERGRLP